MFRTAMQRTLSCNTSNKLLCSPQPSAGSEVCVPDGVLCMHCAAVCVSRAGQLCDCWCIRSGVQVHAALPGCQPCTAYGVELCLLLLK